MLPSSSRFHVTPIPSRIASTSTWGMAVAGSYVTGHHGLADWSVPPQG